MKYYLVAYDVRYNSSYYYDVRTDCFMRSIQNASPLTTANNGMYHLNKIIAIWMYSDAKVLNKYCVILREGNPFSGKVLYKIGAKE